MIQFDSNSIVRVKCNPKNDKWLIQAISELEYRISKYVNPGPPMLRRLAFLKAKYVDEGYEDIIPKGTVIDCPDILEDFIKAIH
jgi:hypothetical protein